MMVVVVMMVMMTTHGSKRLLLFIGTGARGWKWNLMGVSES